MPPKREGNHREELTKREEFRNPGAHHNQQPIYESNQPIIQGSRNASRQGGPVLPPHHRAPISTPIRLDQTLQRSTPTPLDQKEKPPIAIHRKQMSARARARVCVCGSSLTALRCATKTYTYIHTFYKH